VIGATSEHGMAEDAWMYAMYASHFVFLKRNELTTPNQPQRATTDSLLPIEKEGHEIRFFYYLFVCLLDG